MKIKYVNHSIGNNFGSFIELNKNLLKYPKLHDSVLKHELKHTNKKFSKEDLLLDLGECGFNNFKMLQFMLKHPKSFWQLIPIYHKKGIGIIYDLNLIIIYFVLFLFLSVTLFISSWS